MSPDSRDTPRQHRTTESDRSAATAPLGRRRVLQLGATASVVTVAGCVAGDDEDDGNGDDDDGNGGSDTDGDDEDDATPPADVIGAFLEAAADEDMDALADAVHSASPFHPDWYEGTEWEFEGGDEEFDETAEIETEILDEDAAVEDVFELEDAAFLFDEDELADDIGDEEILLVRAETDYQETASSQGTGGDSDSGIGSGSGSDGDADEDVWVLVTESGERRVLWAGTEDETPDDPEEAFEDPIEDEDNDVVEEIDWEYDQDHDGELVEDVEWAQVVLTDSPGIEADAVRIESTIEGWESEFYGEAVNAWSGAWANVALHDGGDQIVVTAITDGTEEVVHRVHYDPEEHDQNE